MIIGTTIGIVGLVLTLIFGIYTIWFNRKSKKKVSIGIEKKECYSLFKSDINRLNIDVKYSGQSIDNYLVLFKGVIRNNGQTDIDKNRIYKPIQIKTKSNYKWLEISVKDNPEGASVTFNKIDDETLEVNWDLLKKSECIEFESLIEIPQDTELDEISDDFYDSLNFDFRITDLNKIEKLSEINSKEKNRRYLNRKRYLLGAFAILAGMFIMFSNKLPESIAIMTLKPTLVYNVVNQSDTIQTPIKSTHNKKIELVVNNSKVKISLDEFNKEYEILNVQELEIEEWQFWFNKIMGTLYILIGCFFFVTPYFRKKKLPPIKAKFHGR